MRDVEVDVSGAVLLAGHATAGGSSFFIYGRTTILAGTVEVISDAIYIEGKFWLEALEVSVSPRLSVRPKKDAEFGWGGDVGHLYPWSGYGSTLPPPYLIDNPRDILSKMISECASRLPSGVLVVTDEYKFSEAENRWAPRMFPNAFPQILKLLIKHGLAHAEGFGTYAQSKYRIHLNTTWRDIQTALVGEPTDPRLAELINEARNTVTLA
jgi:hypothetical protein